MARSAVVSFGWSTQKLLTSVPGIGKTIARTLIAEMPKLGRLSQRQITALAGPAPWTRPVRPVARPEPVGGGRAPVRSALFIGASVASRHDPMFKAYRDKLVKAGKPIMVAIIAVARNSSQSSMPSSGTTGHGNHKMLET